MSATAIAQVTVALKELLRANLANTVSVSLLQPSDNLTKNSVNLYLFRVVENAQLKNTDWRGDRAHAAAPFPALALELYYLMTPFADPPTPSEKKLPDAHSLLGSAMQVFHDHPVVNDVHSAAFDFDVLTGINDLRNAFDKIIVRLQSTTTEELSKIWMMFNQPYRLSVVYQVSLVQIAPTVPVTGPAAPVLVTALDVFPADPPSLVALTPARGGTGGPLDVRGHGLARKSFTTRVTFGGQEVDPTSLAEDLVRITVPSLLGAGPEQEVRVSLDGLTSTALSYVVAPWLRRLEPLRGAPDAAPLPVVLTINGSDLLAAGTIAVRLDGAPLAHTIVDGSHLRIGIPIATPNGLHAIQVSVAGQASNTREFEVIPLIRTLAPPAPVVGNPLAISGARLDGSQVVVRFGPAAVLIGSNATAGQIQVPHVPRLESGSYELRVAVDGRESGPFPFVIA